MARAAVSGNVGHNVPDMATGTSPDLIAPPTGPVPAWGRAGGMEPRGGGVPLTSR